MNNLRLPSRALARVNDAIQAMNDEDRKPHRLRDPHVYARGYAIIETYGLLLNVQDPSYPDPVREAVASCIDPTLD